jgi:hypothetical protein
MRLSPHGWDNDFIKKSVRELLLFLLLDKDLYIFLGGQNLQDTTLEIEPRHSSDTKPNDGFILGFTVFIL